MEVSTLPKKQKRGIIFIVIGANFLFLLNQFLLITAYPVIMRDFSINATQVQWLTTSFLLVTSIFILMTGYLIDRFTTRHLVISSLVMLVIGTLVGWLASSFVILVVARIIQAIGAGIMLPLVQTILLMVYPENQRGRAMGLLGFVMNVAPAIGPSIAGLIVDFYSWPYLFLIILPPAFLFLILASLYMVNVTERRPTQLDIPSLVLSSISLTGILYGTSMISVVGFVHWLVGLPLLIGILCLGLFIKRQNMLKLPTLNVTIMKNKAFAWMTGSVFIIAMLLLSAETILPLFSQNAQGSSAFVAGILLFPGTVILSITSLLGGHLFDKYGGKTVISSGFLLLMAACFLFISFEKETSPIYVSAIFCIFMAGIGLTMMPQVTMAMNRLPRSELAHGTSIMTTLRQFGMGIGVTLLTTMISIRTTDTALPYEEAFLRGTRGAFIAMSVLAILAFGLFVWGRRKREP
ncbi:DHA2 family efflux MFS transporter permease subunit [Alteribacillus iranensis]|uniref:Drug resistance transporter, EmrB/QacA subfamily n=1 Tax=Alteribacillus iranensis TaxID=930128 RepID=A0A1I2EZB5_9BACI|nr:DHA2 family efflux MFS transporter permease subunit [Alteribacillus iranensis]SFE98494.1 drug resistance transporter, EmrB/QacA subfamily [Alteribacillus iranensis]